jgi:transposase
MRFEGLLERWEGGEIDQAAAAEMLGVSERTFRRWRDRHAEEGAAGLLDRRIGKPSGRRASEAELRRMLGLYESRYAGFTVKHFHEQLQKRHGYKLGYTVTKLSLHAAGLVKPAPRRSAHRKKRPRRALPGMLLHQDASRFCWLGRGLEHDLVVTMDDASNQIYSAFLVEEEGTLSSFQGLAETIAAHGLFCELYTDRASHYFHTPKAGGKVDQQAPSQIGRALAQLSIRHIAAYSPQARGRSERMFRTLQDRLPKEIELAGISEPAAANQWLAESYIPAHNARFAVAPAEPGSAFTPAEPALWRDVLCVQEQRVVGNDNTVRYRNLVLQLPETPQRRHFVKASVRVHEYHDRSLAVFHGPLAIARFDPGGNPIVDPAPTAAARSRKSVPQPARGYVDNARPLPTSPQAQQPPAL